MVGMSWKKHDEEEKEAGAFAPKVAKPVSVRLPRVTEVATFAPKVRKPPVVRIR